MYGFLCCIKVFKLIRYIYFILITLGGGSEKDLAAIYVQEVFYALL